MIASRNPRCKVIKNVIVDAELVAFSDRLHKTDGVQIILSFCGYFFADVIVSKNSGEFVA